jgi:hypothetical protein
MNWAIRPTLVRQPWRGTEVATQCQDHGRRRNPGDNGSGLWQLGQNEILDGRLDEAAFTLPPLLAASRSDTSTRASG